MKRLLTVALFLCCLTAAVPLAYAQEAAEKAPAEAAEDSPVRDILKWVNLLLLVGGAGYLLKKPAHDFFESRRDEISSGLDRAKTAQEESFRRMKDIELRLSRLSTEIAALKAQAEAESSKERESILADAKRDMEHLVLQSRQEIDRIARGIERDIKLKVADAVIDRAGRTLETQMTEDDQKRVVIRFLNQV